MNPLNNFVQNLISGNAVFFIIFGAVAFSVWAVIAAQIKENSYLKIFLPENYKEITANLNPIDSFAGYGVFKYNFASKIRFSFELYEEGLVICERYEKACLITDFTSLKLTKNSFLTNKLTWEKDGNILEIMLMPKDYLTLQNFINNFKKV